MAYAPSSLQSLNAAIAAGRSGEPDAPLLALPNSPGSASAVSWGAIFAGAAAAAALSLILLMLGVGLGLSSVSPWAGSGISAGTFGTSTIIWLTVTQLLASAMGGYLAGRLRTKWLAVHSDEVYFRDTAHGFLAWALAALVTAAMLTSAIGTIVGAGMGAGASVTGAAVVSAAAAATTGDTAQEANGSVRYFVDALLRRDLGAMGSTTSAQPLLEASEQAATKVEIARIYINTVRAGALPADDLRYVAQVVVQRTGMSQQDAEKRVSDTYTRVQTRLRDAQQAALDATDKARKTSAYAALWVFISLLIGAFVASLGATYGGKHRDA